MEAIDGQTDRFDAKMFLFTSARGRGDWIAEPRLTGTWLAHLLISSSEILQNLLIESARMPPSGT